MKKRKLNKTIVIKWVRTMLCLALVCLLYPTVHANAAADVQKTEMNMLMTANKAAPMKAEPSSDAETLMIYEEGALVFVIGETADGWYHVTYQDKEGYVQKALLDVQEIDVEGLDAEMAVNEEEAKLVVEAVEKYRAESRRSKIWGSVIIVLVVGIFAVGFFSNVKTGKSDTNASHEKNKKKIKIEDWN